MSLENLQMIGGFLVDTSFKYPSYLNETVEKASKDIEEDMYYGLPDKKFPLKDKAHVNNAKSRYHFCPKDKQEQLSKNIFYRSLELKMPVKPEGQWFDALDADMQGEIKKHFKKDGEHYGNKYPDYLVPKDFNLNEAVMSIIEMHDVKQKQILTVAGAILDAGDKALPDVDDLETLFSNVLSHLNTLVEFVGTLSREVPYFALDRHFLMNSPECEKREPRLIDINKYAGRVAMHRDTIDQLPKSITNTYIPRYNVSYNETFGWSLRGFSDLTKVEEFAPPVIIADSKRIELLPIWNLFHTNRTCLSDMINYNIGTGNIADDMRYLSRERAGGPDSPVCDDDYSSIGKPKMMKEIIVTRAKWLKSRVNELLVEVGRGNQYPEKKSSDDWFKIMTNEIVLLDCVAVILALGIWAEYNTAMGFFDEVHPKLLNLIKELDKQA